MILLKIAMWTMIALWAAGLGVGLRLVWLDYFKQRRDKRREEN